MYAVLLQNTRTNAKFIFRPKRLYKKFTNCRKHTVLKTNTPPLTDFVTKRQRRPIQAFQILTEDFVYPDKPKIRHFFQSRDTYGEIERIACKIVDLVRDDGYRFKDIALLCGDENDYRHLIEAVFSEYEIPYFTDRTII